jgi:hypothetical protein
MSSRRSALALAVSRASVMKRVTSVRLSASRVTTRSAFVVRSAMMRRCAASSASTLSVSRSAGLARRIVSLRSVPRAASAAPSSPTMIEKRSR